MDLDPPEAREPTPPPPPVPTTRSGRRRRLPKCLDDFLPLSLNPVQMLTTPAMQEAQEQQDCTRRDASSGGRSSSGKATNTRTRKRPSSPSTPLPFSQNQPLSVSTENIPANHSKILTIAPHLTSFAMRQHLKMIPRHLRQAPAVSHSPLSRQYRAKA